MGRDQSWTYQTINNSLAFKQFIFGLPSEVYRTAADLIGSPNLATVSPAFRMDSPGDDRHLRFWHQDSSYFLETESGDSALVLWIPLCRATAANGAISVCPGSHKLGRLASLYAPPGEDGASEQYEMPEQIVGGYEHVQVEADVGDVLFVHMDLIHGSNRNTSDETRLTAQLRLAAYDDVTFSPVQLRPLYSVERVR
jgi:ectoine hydroxylase-related dioxygenase (phytanoyl-CoA dioxygenase family)